MIDRRPDKGQTESDVNSFAERKRFDRDRRLIMIQSDDSNELAFRCTEKYRVRRVWSADIDTRGRAFLDGGNNLVLFLGPEHAAFGSVRVEPGDRDRDLCVQKLTRFLVCESNKFSEPFLSYQTDRFHQRQVCGKQHNT